MKRTLEQQFWDAAHAVFLPGSWGVTSESVKRALDLERMTPNPDTKLKKLFELAHTLDGTLDKTFSDEQTVLDNRLKGRN